MIIKAFNVVFFGLILFLAQIIVLLWFICRNKSTKFRKILIIVLSIANIIFFFVYKYFLSQDQEFLIINDIDKFNWWNELPLQLCNINMFIIPLSLILNKKFLMGFSFFLAPLGALLSFMFPEPAFTGYSLFLMRNIGFYLTHGMIIVLGISLCTLGFFKSNFRILPAIALTLLALACLMHGVNVLLRATVCPYANYFFTYPADISLLALFYRWIPVPLLYLLPGLVILAVYTSGVTLPFVLRKRKG